MNRIDDYKAKIPDGEERPTPPSSIQVDAKEDLVSYNGAYPSKPSLDGEQILIALLKVTYFFDLFQYVARKLYNGKNIETKVSKLKSVHPKLFYLCFFLDLFIRALILIFLIFLSCFSVYKLLILRAY